jgi:hypothetical protein
MAKISFVILEFSPIYRCRNDYGGGHLIVPADLHHTTVFILIDQATMMVEEPSSLGFFVHENRRGNVMADDQLFDDFETVIDSTDISKCHDLKPDGDEPFRHHRRYVDNAGDDDDVVLFGDGLHRPSSSIENTAKQKASYGNPYWTTRRGRRFLPSSFVGKLNHIRRRGNNNEMRPIEMENQASLSSSDDLHRSSSTQYSTYSKRTTRAACFWLLAFLFVIVFLLVVVRSVSSNNDNSNDDGTQVPVSVARASTIDGIDFYLNRQGVSTKTQTTAPGTPHSFAVDWIANIDPRNVSVPFGQGTVNGDGYQFMIRYLMALLYFSLDVIEDPHNRQHHPRHHSSESSSSSPLTAADVLALSSSSSTLISKMNWLSQDHVCDWQTETRSRESDNVQIYFGVACNEDENIIGLFFDDANLTGTLPTELGKLLSLKSLDASGNRIQGSIPTEYCLMHPLRRLSLGENQLNGTIPECFGDLSNLETIFLSSNELNGTIPPALSLLTSLKHLSLDNNQFVGDPASVFNRMTHLEYFLVSECCCSWCLLASFSFSFCLAEYSFCQHFLVLNDKINNNLFNGTINDSFLAQATSLQYLDSTYTF